jgi:hypothetical protein
MSDMVRSRSLALIMALVGLVLLAAGCDENPVGRICFLGNDAGGASTATVASPALECPSRTCLQVPLQPGAQLPPGHAENDPLCTAECSSDDDCDRVPESPCVNGFACAVPVVVGPFCCRKLCVCKDYLLIPDGGVPIPEACDETNPANTCANLPGR